MEKDLTSRQQAHDLAIIWTKTKWNKACNDNPEMLKDVDEYVAMDELADAYKDAFDYFYSSLDPTGGI